MFRALMRLQWPQSCSQFLYQCRNLSQTKLEREAICWNTASVFCRIVNCSNLFGHELIILWYSGSKHENWWLLYIQTILTVIYEAWKFYKIYIALHANNASIVFVSVINASQVGWQCWFEYGTDVDDGTNIDIASYISPNESNKHSISHRSAYELTKCRTNTFHISLCRCPSYK